ncbi:hypothetical protein NQ318_007150, partial [Aromia moschata]
IDDTKTLSEIYEFVEEIGHGSYGIVISAIEKHTAKNYAIKIVNKFTAGINKLEEVYGEIRILKLVEHPNIIHLEKVYESPRKLYMVFERCSKNLYTQKKQFSEKVCKKIIRQLVGAVHYLHKHDIVHRDIKMENILLATNPDNPCDEFFIKLSDFGLSIVKNGSGIHGMLKEYCGTSIYMPPEMLLQHTYSELCDVWAVGIILYILLFGKYPFFSTKEEELRPTAAAPPGIISSNVIDFIKSILQKDPVNRITAVEMLKHPWLQDSRCRGRKDESVLNYMKKWRKEMQLCSGEESDWLSAITDLDSATTLNIFTSVTSRIQNGVDASTKGKDTAEKFDSGKCTHYKPQKSQDDSMAVLHYLRK